MKIKKLSVTSLRGIMQGYFHFNPGMNLLVGVNGVGKTTILEALRVCLSQVLPSITISNNKKENFSIEDIKIGQPFMSIRFDMERDEKEVSIVLNQSREKYEYNYDFSRFITIKDNGGERSFSKSDKDKFQKHEEQPIVLYFSTKRSLISNKAPAKSSVSGGQLAAYAEALSVNREFNLPTFAQWYKVQKALVEEKPLVKKHIDAIDNAITQFLPGFSNIQLEDTSKGPRFTIEKEEIRLNIDQLSDGERGLLSLILDISKRLSQANPDLPNPLEGTGIILIDELDLHLHPKWQRMVVEKLTTIFPNCQFICTSHSPQIIPALEPERIHIINRGEIIRPDRSLGMDTNWILKHLMESDDRPEISIKAIAEVEQLIDDVEFDGARELIDRYKSEGLDISEWVIYEARMSNLEILADEDEEDN